jgi:succinate dehydrogenase/fumarate reductase flavoprotein subunit
LYANNGIDLYKKPLEISVCAQHNNGGLSCDMWWESNIRGFFPVGEAAGTHGVYRPGGSALNAGQCGAARAAMAIAKRRLLPRDGDDADTADITDTVLKINKIAKNISGVSGVSNVSETKREIGAAMSKIAAHIRDGEKIAEAIDTAKEKYLNFWENVKLKDISELPDALKNRDLLIAQYVYLCAMHDYIKRGGVSRGSYIITSENCGVKIHDKLNLRYIAGNDENSGKIQEINLAGGKTRITWRDCRPIPDAPRWFENVWKEYSANLP